jgi:hypothetical protein
MFQLTFPCDGTVARASISKAILALGKVQLCLVQLDKPASDVIAGDQSRANAVAVIRDLLLCTDAQPVPALREMNPGNVMAVMLLPELALGSSDWDAVDVLVRATDRPLVLIAGFGFSPGKTVLDWKAVQPDEGTVRHVGWEDGDDPSSVMLVNGAWCWVHFPGEQTHCVVITKNTQEQSIEAVEFAHVQQGKTILHLRFDDVDLFPLICSDMLRLPDDNDASAQARVRRSIAHEDDPERPALILGSLLQPKYNANWQVAIDRAVSHSLAGRKGAVALCNIAINKPEADEEVDRWRSLTGAYVRLSELSKGQRTLPVARTLKAPAISGAVARVTTASVHSGPVGWRPFNVMDENFVWQGKLNAKIGEAGLALPLAPPPAIAATELLRFLDRFPSDPGFAPRLNDGVQQLTERVESAQRPLAQVIINTLLKGTTGEGVDPDCLHPPDVQQALKAGLHALATLKSIECIGWQADSSQTGQLVTNGGMNVLVWRSPSESGKTMRRRLSVWKLTPQLHPKLVVFGAGPHTELPPGEIEDDRRDDFTTTPKSSADLEAAGMLQASNDDFTAPRVVRRVVGFPLSQVAALYAEYDAEEDKAKVDALVAVIDGAFA